MRRADLVALAAWGRSAAEGARREPAAAFVALAATHPDDLILTFSVLLASDTILQLDYSSFSIPIAQSETMRYSMVKAATLALLGLGNVFLGVNAYPTSVTEVQDVS